MKFPQFIKKKRISIFLTSMFIAVFCYPWLALSLNPPPAENQLKHTTAIIKSVSRNSPNLTAITGDGEVITFNSPPTDYTLIRGFPANSFLSLKSAYLQNCPATIYYDEMKFMVFRDTRRIWGIRCSQMNISYQEIVSHYVKTKNISRIIDAFILIFFVAFCSLMFYYEGVKNGNKHSS